MPADLFTLFRYLFIFLRGVALRVAFMEHRGGALVAFTAFVAFMRRLGWSRFVAFRVFVTFMEHWDGTLVTFRVFVLFMEVGVGRLWLSQHC